MSDNIIKKAISAVLALGMAGISHPILANEQTNNMMESPSPQGMEKCFGIARVGFNDCGNASHNCGGEAKIDRDVKEWIYVPAGLCKKIAGGTTNPPPESKLE